MQNGKVHSFSPAFEHLATYGDKEVEPHHQEPYAKRADPDHQPDPKTLSPHVRQSEWLISPQSSMNNVLQAKKEEARRIKSVFGKGLPVSRKMERKFQVEVSAKDENHPAQIKVLQEDDSNDDEEEKLAPTPVASFLIQENSSDDKFPWSIVNAETGLELAFYKHKATDFASHLEGGEKLRKERQLELELYGKTPLYQAQKYRKRHKDSQEIIYHWASTKIRHASKVFGFFSVSESIEMTTKNETPVDYKLVKLPGTGGFAVEWTGSRKHKEAAIGEIMENGRLRLTIRPKVDPTLIIIFLAMTGTLTT